MCGEPLLDTSPNGWAKAGDTRNIEVSFSLTTEAFMLMAFISLTQGMQARSNSS
jgi:hypothetical protein